MAPPIGKTIDISLDLDARNFAMRTPAGFKERTCSWPNQQTVAQ
jgi:hypothetical protein